MKDLIDLYDSPSCENSRGEMTGILVDIPSLLELPSSGHLTLITGVLGATPNWIVWSIISAALHKSHGQPRHDAVVFVSFMRSYDFWKSRLSRIVGSEPAMLNWYLEAADKDD